MVGALDVPECVFCGVLTPSDEAIFTQGDVVCRPCGHKRGLIEEQHSRSGRGAELTVLASIDGLTYIDGVSGRGGRQRAQVVGVRIGRKRLEKDWRQELLENLEDEVADEEWRVELYCRELRKEIEQGIETELLSLDCLTATLSRRITRGIEEALAIREKWLTRAVLVLCNVENLNTATTDELRAAIRCAKSKRHLAKPVAGLPSAPRCVIASKVAAQRHKVSRQQQRHANLRQSFTSGLSVRRAAALAFCAKGTAARHYRVFRAQLGEAVCGCGQAARHQGWCAWRLAQSEARLRFLRERWGRHVAA